MASNSQPAYRAYVVIERENADPFWLPIGAAFRHQSGDGLNIILQALPVGNGDGTCKIVLRPPKADDEQDKQTVRDANDRRRSR
jgi:hypothetical protein